MLGRMICRSGVFGLLLLLLAAGVRAGQAEDLARIHVEAIGGIPRLRALGAVRATGKVLTAGRELAFEMVARRPNRVRVTMRAEGLTLVQAYDGVNTPWRLEPEKAAAAKALNVDEAREFRADAEFDDPLVSATERGYQLDFAGETDWQGIRALKILVTHLDADPSMLLLDPDTFFIVARRTTRRMPSGREVTIETKFDDFRPVEGVIFPYRIEVFAEGNSLRVTVLSTVEAIPVPPDGMFAMPAAARP